MRYAEFLRRLAPAITRSLWVPRSPGTDGPVTRLGMLCGNVSRRAAGDSAGGPKARSLRVSTSRRSGSGVKIDDCPTGGRKKPRWPHVAGVMELDYVCPREPGQGIADGVADDVMTHAAYLGPSLHGRTVRQILLANLHPVQRAVAVHHREPRTSLPCRRKCVHRCGALAISRGSRRGHCPYAGHIDSVTPR